MVARRRESPYVGPRPFQPGEGEIFRGRDRETQDLLSLIVAHGEVLLHSLSGAGKSSLINAGLIVKLEEEGFEVLPPARVQGLLPETHDPHQISNFYTFNALQSWADADIESQRVANLSLANYLNARSRKTNSQGIPLPRVVIFDQFEELFTTYPERWEDRRSFLIQIGQALRGDRSLRVLFVMRDEYVAQLLSFASLFPERLRTRFPLERLRYEAALAAVTEPAQTGGRFFTEGVAERLVEDLLQGPMVTSTGETRMVRGEFVEPVQLQVVCDRLWRELPPEIEDISFQHLETFGDVNQALMHYYEDAIAEAARSTRVRRRRLRKWFETRLITEEGTRATIFRGERKTGGMPNRTVDVLQELHVVRPENRAGAHWYELTHDRLIEPIRLVAREKRRRLTRALAVAATLIALLGGSMLAWQINTERLKAQKIKIERGTERARAVISNPETSPQLRIRAALRLALSMRTVGREVSLDIRNALRQAIQEATLKATVVAHNSLVTGAAFSPDGQQLATVGEDNILHLRDAVSGRQSARLTGQAAAIQGVAFGPDERSLITVDKGGAVLQWRAPWTSPHGAALAIQPSDLLDISPGGRWVVTRDNDRVVVWDTVSNRRRFALENYKVGAVAISPNGKRLAITSKQTNVLDIWEIPSNARSFRRLVSLDTIRTMAFSTNGERLALGLTDGTVKIWHLAHTRRPGGQEVVTFRGHQGEVLDLAFSRQGELLASSSQDRTVKVWDVVFGKELHTFTGHTAAVDRVVFAADGSRLASSDTDKTVRIWELSYPFAFGPVQSLRGHGNGLKSIAFSAEGGRLASGDRSGQLRLWEVDSGRAVRMWSGQKNGQLRGIALNRQGTRLAALDGNQVRIWDTNTGKELFKLFRQGAGLLAVALSPDEKYMATASWDGTAVLWDVKAKQQLYTLSGHRSVVWDLAFNHTGKRLATASKDTTVIVWDVITGKELFTLQGHTKDVRRVVFNASGTRLATASWDNTAAVWDAASGQKLLTFRGHTRPVNSVMFSHDSALLVTASNDGTSRVWDANTGETRLTYRGHRKAVRAAVFSPDSTRVASVSADKTTHIWDTKTGQTSLVLPRQAATIWSVSFSPDARRVATASGNKGTEDNVVKVWNARSGELLWQGDHDARVNQVVFTRDGERVVSVSDDQTVRWWVLTSGQEAVRLEIPVRRIAMHPDGTHIAMAIGNNIVIWDTQKLVERPFLEPQVGIIDDVVYSPDGRRLAAVSKDGTIKVWDIQTEKVLFSLKREGEALRTLAFSWDGLRLAAAGTNGLPTVWDTVTGEPVGTMSGQGYGALDVALNRQGKLVATVGEDNSIRVWEVASKALLLERSAKTQRLQHIAFSPDGKYLAISAESARDGVLHLYSTGAFTTVDLDALIAEGFASFPELLYQGIAKALMKDHAGALKDFETLLRQSPNTSDAKTYRTWKTTLEAGENPFTSDTLLQLVME